MFLRDTANITLDELRDKLDTGAETVLTQANHIAVNVDTDADRTVTFGDGTPHEVVCDETALKSLASVLDIPTAFLLRQERDLQQHLIQTLLDKHGAAPLAVVFTDDGIQEIRPGGIQVIDSRRIVDVARHVIDPSATVVEWRKDPAEFAFDVIAPENFDRGIGGDLQVGDITHGGVRFGHDIKHNLAPWVQPYVFRLVCTNGMETSDDGFKVDARGLSVEQVLSELEAQAQRAFSRVEADIDAFYELRQNPVENPERWLRAHADEAGLPDRTLATLIRRAGTEALPDDPTEFDLVNLVTNEANDPRIRNRTGARRALEQTGGNVVVHQAERCAHCQSRLN